MYKKIRMAYNSTICIDTIKRHAEFYFNSRIFLLHLRHFFLQVPLTYMYVLTRIKETVHTMNLQVLKL